MREENKYFYTASLLKGEAAAYYDGLELEINDWQTFMAALERRYCTLKQDIMTLYHTVLTRKQYVDMGTRKFCKYIYEIGKEAKIEEEVIIQSIINNMNTKNKSYYKLHLRNEMTFKKLINFIEIL